MKIKRPKLVLTRGQIIAVVRHTGKKIDVHYNDQECLWVWNEWNDSWKRKILICYLWDKVKQILLLIVKVRYEA